ncbi:hypothetical protein AAFF_G00074110 [Aldrovandia affinis]|uniref:Uncharacterized protein n=1 Tax=Aldrovandia affinis TaxID=143900 RepID=A0AAD7WDB1_9TELE|nr:hypothetical protein AAFF_G00074110 [Aldrovandia affinis]
MSRLDVLEFVTLRLGGRPHGWPGDEGPPPRLTMPSLPPPPRCPLFRSLCAVVFLGLSRGVRAGIVAGASRLCQVPWGLRGLAAAVRGWDREGGAPLSLA